MRDHGESLAGFARVRSKLEGALRNPAAFRGNVCRVADGLSGAAA